MRVSKAAFALLFSLLFLMACSDNGNDGGEILARYDENGVQYSPTEIDGIVGYMPSMKAESVRIVVVDASLNPVDSFEVPIDSLDWNSTGFKVGSRDYEYPYVKLVTIFPLGKNGKMEFPQYLNLQRYNSNIFLQFYGALISGRVETLVRNKGLHLRDAKEQAYKELNNALGASIGSPESRAFYDRDDYGKQGLFDLWGYILCRHEISDSLFYSDFKELRDSFAKEGTVSASIKVRAADAWLSTFKISSDSMERELFKSSSRDTFSVLKRLDTTFFKWAYGFDAAWKDSVKIENEHSEYNGRMFVYEERCNLSSCGWRLKAPLEEKIGACLYFRSRYAELDGVFYLCRDESFVWEPVSDVDTILSYKYIRCDGKSYGDYGEIGFYKDNMYVCDCESANKCNWTEVKKDFKATVLDTPTVSVLATQLYGECRGHDGEKHVMDSILVRCHWSKWLKVDTLSYYMGICKNSSNRDEFGQMENGDYYKCRAYGGEKWERCTYADVKGDLCNWVTADIYKKYDDKYFHCKNEKWNEVSEEDVYAPVVKGDSCTSKNEKEIKKYGEEYFVCRRIVTEGKELYYWQIANESDLELYKDEN